MIALAPSHKSQLNNYTSWLEKIGVPYHILNENDIVSDFSMLILCGGPDIGDNIKRDQIETKWFNEAYGKIPVLGICRGMQLANVCLGGTLHQDLPINPVKHNTLILEGVKASLLESSFHYVELIEMGFGFKVNSRHHQSVNILAEGLKATAYCKEDNIVEMAEGKNSLFVQWHPEREDVWGTGAEIIVSDWVKMNI